MENGNVTLRSLFQCRTLGGLFRKRLAHCNVIFTRKLTEKHRSHTSPIDIGSGPFAGSPVIRGRRRSDPEATQALSENLGIRILRGGEQVVFIIVVPRDRCKGNEIRPR
jgi:hypothetical protein